VRTPVVVILADNKKSSNTASLHEKIS